MEKPCANGAEPAVRLRGAAINAELRAAPPLQSETPTRSRIDGWVDCKSFRVGSVISLQRSNAGAQPRGPQHGGSRCPIGSAARVGCSGLLDGLSGSFGTACKVHEPFGEGLNT